MLSLRPHHPMNLHPPAEFLCSLGFACTAAGTLDSGTPEACQWGQLDSDAPTTFEEALAGCNGYNGGLVVETSTCTDGRRELDCSDDYLHLNTCFSANGVAIGRMAPAGDWATPHPVPYGEGTWCDCDGDGWPPTLERYCELRGELPP